MHSTDYVKLITSEHANKPRFVATVELLTGALHDVSMAASGLTQAFSVDSAVGKQLDILGLWVGVDRALRVPIEDAYFTWDDPDLGWNMANWKGPFEPTEGIVTLDDTTYRVAIQAKIGSNYWGGSNAELNSIAMESFASAGVTCFVVDNFDMSISVYILGGPTAAMIELIKRGLAPPKPAGVRVAGYYLQDGLDAPFFALSVPTTSLTAGLDFGSFGNPV